MVAALLLLVLAAPWPSGSTAAAGHAPVSRPLEIVGDGPGDGARRARREALWVFTDEVTGADRRAELLRRARLRGVNLLYLNVYRPQPNGHGRRLLPEADLRLFIRAAHQLGIEVWATYSAVSWTVLARGAASIPRRRLREVVAFNRADDEAAFDGVMLNLEPPEPVDHASLLGLYHDLFDEAGPAGLSLAATLRFAWRQEAPCPRTGARRPAYEHYLELPFDHVVVMAYRNYAGRSCHDDDGTICLSEPTVGYASRSGKPGRVVVGLRTSSPHEDGGYWKETFHHLGEADLVRERDAIARHFDGWIGFGGFATHQYREADLPHPWPQAVRPAPASGSAAGGGQGRARGSARGPGRPASSSPGG